MVAPANLLGILPNSTNQLPKAAMRFVIGVRACSWLACKSGHTRVSVRFTTTWADMVLSTTKLKKLRTHCSD